ncbi:MAG: 50S ribosomal protein L31 [Cyclonatronaceae bacterium]
MKKDIHPEYNEIKVVMSDGSEIMTRSTMKARDGVYRAEVDSKNHPFYNDEKKMLTTAGRIDKFNKRYARKKK